MKKRLIVSFSGGRTSAYMLWWIFNAWEDRNNWEIIVVFANTGKEVEGTLFFIDECSQEWGIPIIWVEAVPISIKGWEVEAKIVTYETASRKGEPFEAMIAKLGIPSSAAPFCSVQLKRAAIIAYAKSIGWDRFSYSVAIGVRFDEPDRVNRNNSVQSVLYPFVDLFPVNKSQVMQWWGHQSFDLSIHPDEGNCDACWKKDEERLCRIMIRKPKVFYWWDLMVQKYGHMDPRNSGLKPPFNFYRGNKSVEEIRAMSLISQAQIKQLSLSFKSDGCNESCEPF